MSDGMSPVGNADNDGVSASRELVANEIQFASAFVTPFAAAVACELEEFGLSKNKINEIIWRSAKRFGAMNEEKPSGLGEPQTDSDDTSVGFLGWLWTAGGQAFDFLASVVVKHGPGFVDELTPIVKDALLQAIAAYVRSAAGSIRR